MPNHPVYRSILSCPHLNPMQGPHTLTEAEIYGSYQRYSRVIPAKPRPPVSPKRRKVPNLSELDNRALIKAMQEADAAGDTKKLDQILEEIEKRNKTQHRSIIKRIFDWIKRLFR